MTLHPETIAYLKKNKKFPAFYGGVLKDVVSEAVKDRDWTCLEQAIEALLDDDGKDFS